MSASDSFIQGWAIQQTEVPSRRTKRFTSKYRGAPTAGASGAIRGVLGGGLGAIAGEGLLLAAGAGGGVEAGAGRVGAGLAAGCWLGHAGVEMML